MKKANESMVRAAECAFKKHDYPEAADLYGQLAELIGEASFAANLQICRARIRKERARNIDHASLRSLKVACIVDEFTHHSFAPECVLFQLSPQHGIEELEQFQPDLLFVESAWRGKDDAWERKVATLSEELKEILRWCKVHAIPTAFWNKEDPVHFSTFLSLAQRFDAVFTTDLDCIPRYKAQLKSDRVYLLPFACQPRIHNPIELYDRKQAFCFAGAYYTRYPERMVDLQNFAGELPRYAKLEIFDRNFGKDNVDYMFPAEYEKYIVGTLSYNEIDRAYKGYEYAINLNSIKQSQSMFARRVFELLGSNTITVSNFSRGIRLLFGNLVFASDSGQEILRRLRDCGDDVRAKLKLAALRKVMSEHTYAHRLAYVFAKSAHWHGCVKMPQINVVAVVRTTKDHSRIVSGYRAQTYANKRLWLIGAENGASDAGDITDDDAIVTFDLNSFTRTIAERRSSLEDWYAFWHCDDYYGENYLYDLALASKYCNKAVIGKRAHFALESKVASIRHQASAYRECNRFALRASMIRSDVMARQTNLNEKLGNLSAAFVDEVGLAIDPYNYCANGWQSHDLTFVKELVGDLAIDRGIALDEVSSAAEWMPKDAASEELPKWSSEELSRHAGQSPIRDVQIAVSEDGLRVTSALAEKAHIYTQGGTVLAVTDLPVATVKYLHLETTPGLNLQWVVYFLNERKERIGHIIEPANADVELSIHEGTRFVRFGFRVLGSGVCLIKGLYFGKRNTVPTTILSGHEVLLITNQYPAYNDLYRNAFVHGRVLAYGERGVPVDVFQLTTGFGCQYREFENVDIIRGGNRALDVLLRDMRYGTVAVHFMTVEAWEVLIRYPQVKKVVWIHGFEAQAWHRRAYLYASERERNGAIEESEKRIEFWRAVFARSGENFHFVFVSKYLAESVMEDIGLRLPSAVYTILHNPIDTSLFRYEEKDEAARKKILSIRPFTSKTYANDLSAGAIKLLAQRPYFENLEFRIVGDGPLFDEVTGPLRDFSNVKIDRRFLSRHEIAALHREYGIFLCPSRMDTQGVSRDEAMASGLVPIVSDVGAVSEFVHGGNGVLCPAESSHDLAMAIDKLYRNPNLFANLSRSAAQSVRETRRMEDIVERELGHLVT